mmetsp:Transcript_13351/g.36702  ORF Transcript_13351/g.36702 Transcript_13351/m.36702 type:complete len:209 (+) Transcript_13351:476-1102(+)
MLGSLGTNCKQPLQTHLALLIHVTEVKDVPQCGLVLFRPARTRLMLRLLFTIAGIIDIQIAVLADDIQKLIPLRGPCVPRIHEPKQFLGSEIMAIFRFELPITCRLACSFAIDAFAATLSAEAQTPARAKAILAGSSEHGRLDAKESRMIWKFCECRSEAQEGDSPGATRITQIKDLFYPRLDFIIDASFRILALACNHCGCPFLNNP